MPLLSSAKETIKKEACWTISNITAGNRLQIQVILFCLTLSYPLIIKIFTTKAVFDANIFPKLIEILAKGENKTKKEAAWAVVNATSSGTPDQIRFFFIFILFILRKLKIFSQIFSST